MTALIVGRIANAFSLIESVIGVNSAYVSYEEYGNPRSATLPEGIYRHLSHGEIAQRV